jgi:iron-sulfur cluster repair protein YtfE (RIC family)
MFQTADATPPVLPVLPEDDGDAAAPTDARSDAGPRKVGRAVFAPHARRADLVAAYPELDAVCDRLGFGHGLTLGEWIRDPSWTLLTLAREARPPQAAAPRDLTLATIPELIGHIVEEHHRVLRNELARFRLILDHLAAAQPDGAPAVLGRAFADFAGNLLEHLEQEEAHLFPLCIRLENAALGRSRWLQRDVTALVRHATVGHQEYDAALRQVIGLVETLGTLVPSPDLPLIASGLAALERNLVAHTELEGGLLIPAAIFAEEQLRARQRRHHS